MVKADCDIILCIVGWAVRNGSVEDKAGFESWGQKCRVQWRKWKSGQKVDGLSMKVSRKKTFIYPSGKSKTDEESAQTSCMTKLLYTVKQGECTPVLLNIPHLLLLNWLIERVGARPLASLSLENWGRRKKTNKKKNKQKAAHSNNESTCPREG